MVDRARFMERVRVTDGCWEWQGYRDARGYAKVSIGGRKKQWVHRVAYELHAGPIPDGLTIDHLCRNPSCVNPDHLEPVTIRENIRRANPERSVCRHGHTLADAYIDWTPAGFPHKKCRTCVLGRRRRERLVGANATAASAA